MFNFKCQAILKITVNSQAFRHFQNISDLIYWDRASSTLQILWKYLIQTEWKCSMVFLQIPSDSKFMMPF